jgi:hypothetical protein
MANPGGYVKEIESIKKERKRLTFESRKLLQQQRKAERHLYTYMESTGISEYGGIKKSNIKPKEKVQRKKKKEKKRDAIALFRQTGIPDPEKFWDQLQSTQKAEEAERKSKDNRLGF